MSKPITNNRTLLRKVLQELPRRSRVEIKSWTRNGLTLAETIETGRLGYVQTVERTVRWIEADPRAIPTAASCDEIGWLCGFYAAHNSRRARREQKTQRKAVWHRWATLAIFKAFGLEGMFDPLKLEDRLVAADWLEERGLVQEANMLRPKPKPPGIPIRNEEELFESLKSRQPND